MLAQTQVPVIGLVALAFVSTLTAATPQIVSLPGAIELLDGDGLTIWRIDVSAAASEVVAVENGLITLADGTRIDARGRLVARGFDVWGFTAPDLPRGPLAEWDVPVEITPPPPNSQTHDAHQPPFFDSRGNAWVVNTHIESGSYFLQARRSDGHAGTWQPMVTIPTTTRYVANVEATIDQDDNITAVYREISGGYKLFATRYEPVSGWSAAKEIHTATGFFQAIRVCADEAGNVIVVFDDKVGGQTAAYSMVWEAATNKWSVPQPVSVAGSAILLLNLSRNADASDLYLTYLARGGAGGVYAHQWDPNTLAWSSPTLLPGSETAYYSIASASSRYPTVVDGDGVATVFWGNPEVPYANRNDGGIWQPAVQLATFEIADMENFASAAVSVDNDVFGIASQPDSGMSRMQIFSYVSGQGWRPSENPYSAATILSTRVRVAFYQGDRATATMHGVDGGTTQLISIIREKGTWLPDLIDIPGNDVAYYSDIAADQGEPLLVYEGELGGVNQGIKGTFLRNPHPGDVNCDGEVDFGDINPFVQLLTDRPGWEAAFPDCYPLNGDCNLDGKIDFGDINPFVDLLTSP